MVMLARTCRQKNPSRPSDHNTALVIAFALAVINVIYTGYWAGHTEGVRESGGMLADLPYILEGLHILISASLAICVLGLWLRSACGPVISSFALVSVLAIYGYWYVLTVRYLSELETNFALYSRVQKQVGWFLGATKWDFAVLTLTAVLFAWHVPRLATLFRRKKKEE